ncbi:MULTISPECIES: TolC family protein [Synechococcales]|uniref:TolC family protein n=1 Tax=Synechococcus sp. CS-1324 TaxID=2847980 RepID=UPI00223AD7D2|nr:TolC family protein [Synechococcus sp. CS-1324]
MLRLPRHEVMGSKGNHRFCRSGGSARLSFGLFACWLALQGSAIPTGTRALERSWQRLDSELQWLDQLLPEPAPATDSAGQKPSGSTPAGLEATPPLALPSATQLRRAGSQNLSLEQSIAIALAQSPSLEARRLDVAAALAQLQAQLGAFWPRISALAGLGYSQSASAFGVPQGNGRLGFGPNFAANGLLAADGSTTDGPFFVPGGGNARLSQGVRSVAGRVELELALLDFARQPAIQAARARLRMGRQAYANALRQRQLEVSEAYYGLQRADQLVRIRDADLRNDLVILQDVLALKQAGLVPRLDLLRRRAIEADSEERLIQARADQAIARRRLALLLNLPPGITPGAGDPIALQPRWPLDLESSLLAAYAGNPQLEALLAMREALANEKEARAAELLPSLSLAASAGAAGSQSQQWDASGDCCGATVIPILNTGSTEWSVALTFRWLLFDGGRSAAEVRALARREEGEAQRFAAARNDIRLRLEQAFFNHEASLARLASARRGVAASLEAFRDARLRYQSGLSDEVTLSLTQDRLITSLVGRLEATVAVNITYAQLLRDLLPGPWDSAAAAPPVTLTLPKEEAARWDSAR